MTDIRNLVQRVADAMGPGATPDRIEAVAAVVLDTLQAPSQSVRGPYASPDAGERALITAYGQDRPGILAAITHAVSDAGCNILDVSQKILQGYFTLIMLADVTPMHGSVKELQQRLTDVSAPFHVRALVQHEDLFTAMHRP